MGIKGLHFLNKDQLYDPPITITGKLIVDGYGILHGLYTTKKLEWATGGCYTDQVSATQEYYESLVSAGVEPIVVLDGGGEKSNILDTVYRRNKDINKLCGDLRKQHESLDEDCKEYDSHHLPILSRHVYLSSLKQIDGVKIYVADGKAFKMVVQLANSHGCPVLTNSSNYCISDVKGGVIFTRDLLLSNVTAPIFKQPKLVSLLDLPNPDLIFAVVAIMGDGSDTTVPFLYHGGIREDIKRVCETKGIEIKDRHRYFNIADYLKYHKCHSFLEFKNKIEEFNFGYVQKRKLTDNCRNILETYIIPEERGNEDDIINRITLPCHVSSETESFHQVVRHHREGNYPALVMDAMCVGKCVLDSDIGDAEQPPVPFMGRHLRSLMYGLVSPFMSRSFMKISEYCRSEKPKEGEKPWEYAPSETELLNSWRYKDVLVDKIFDKEPEKRKATAKEAMLDMLEIPEATQETLHKPSDEVYLLGIFTTHYWAHHLYRSSPFDNLDQFIRALVLNFLMCPQREDYSHDQSYFNPMWIKVYHALLQWQCLYKDVCGLNQMLLSPFRELPLTNTLNGSFVIKLTLSGPDSITGCRERLSPEKQDLYDRTVQVLYHTKHSPPNDS